MTAGLAFPLGAAAMGAVMWLLAYVDRKRAERETPLPPKCTWSGCHSWRRAACGSGHCARCCYLHCYNLCIDPRRPDLRVMDGGKR